MKSEPTSYSIEALKKEKETNWTGVRNFQARNFMKQMKKGDVVLFYHSSCDIPGVYGLAKVVGEAEADTTQFDKNSHYYDKRASKEKPVWECVRIAHVKTFKNPIPLGVIRIDPALSEMHILQPGSRLSVTPVSEKEFERVKELGE